jgi:hypothetical protein
VVAVALIVTGEMERVALDGSLKKAFPQVDFSVQMVGGFTSAKVTWPPPKAKGVQSAIEKYATALVAALDPGRKRQKPDFVFGIEDLELANRQDPAEVIRVFRYAINAELDRRRQSMNAHSYQKLSDGVKERCSFHLFTPMTEAYFFADPQVLGKIGCKQSPILKPDSDVELFETTDGAYLDPAAQAASLWAIDQASRPFHPKRYVQFLVEPASYNETTEGVQALLALNWHTVLARPEQTLFLRSMFQDLGHAVGLDPSSFPGKVQPLTSGHGNRSRVLRNL